MRTTAALFLLLVIAHGSTRTPDTRTVEAIAANDNRASAGSLKDGVLAVSLEVRTGTWYPDGRGNPGVDVYAFGEAGSPLQIPGPLLRVTEGTEIRASIHNTLADTLVVHGFYTRDQAARAAKESLRIAPGSVSEVRFQAGKPGTYFYWATTTGEPDWNVAHEAINTQLTGALVIDPRGVTAPDRIFVIGFWSDSTTNIVNDLSALATRFVINGRTWPQTERLSYALGDSIRWRIVNPTSTVHPMHLHGFYFRVLGRGTEDVDAAYPPNAAPDLVFTERLAPGRTALISWVPERPGNWLFHCHDNLHIQPSKPFSAAVREPVAAGAHNHATQFMGGLVLGIEVRSRGSATKASEPERRKLRLIARADPSGSAREPSFGFVLQDGTRTTPSQLSAAGPVMVLTRGQPVSINVVNELAEATAVHWHGIELESYFDGVADFAGMPGRLAPAIAPRDSFEARFTPTRAGTFIYHTHVNEVKQQRAGLAGALLVFEPGERYDPATDLVWLIATPRLDADRESVMLNGSTNPAPLELRAGTRYRIRIINIHTYRPSMRLELKRDTAVLTWRALAKDAVTLPRERATERPASFQIGNGETYDFEFTPAAPGEMRLEITTGAGARLLTQAIRVR
jgi:manganese oxidase